MNINVKKNSDATIIELEGRLDTVTAPELETAINDSIDGTVNMILDLKALAYVSSAGLRVLLGTQKKMQKQGSLKLKNVCEEVMEVLEMTGFADILDIE